MFEALMFPTLIAVIGFTAAFFGFYLKHKELKEEDQLPKRDTSEGDPQ